MKPICLTLAIICVVLFSCGKNRCKDDKLAIQPQPYSGTALRMDGYYYRLDEVNQWDGNIYKLYVPYSEGYLIGRSSTNLMATEQQFSEPGYDGTKLGWGAFKIEGNTLLLEYWTPYMCGFPTRTATATILNDTTFIINQSVSSNQDIEPTYSNDTFRFKYFPAKPTPDPAFYN